MMDTNSDKEPDCILLIDSDSDVQLALTDYLKAQGYRVRSVGSGTEAIKAMDEEVSYATVLLDLALPDMEGISLLKTLSRLNPHLPVIVITGQIEIDQEIQAFHHGVLAFIRKPYNREQVIALLSRAVEVRNLGLKVVEVERALKESEERFQLTVDNINDGVFYLDLSGMVVWANQQAALLIDRPLHETVGHSFMECLSPEAAALAESRLATIRAGGTVPEVVELKTIRSDGTERWIEANVSNIVRNEKVTGRLLVGRDINERKQAEEALVKSELRFRLVARATFDAIWDWDMVTDLVEWNEGIQSLFGYEPDAVGQDVAWWIENVHPEDRTRVKGEVHAVIENGASIWSGEYRFRCYDGNYAIVTDRGYVVHDETGKAIRMVGAMNDITERKQSEEILRASEERYRTLVDSSPSCIHEINLNGQLTSMNPAGLRMMGVTLESEVIGRPYLTAVTEEDQDRVGKLLALAYKGESSNFEFQAVNGRHFQSYFVPIDNNKGAIVKLMGLTQDVTEEKLAKETLRHLSGRVIKAQEEERGHIARELHDDIGQRLALMAVDIQLLSKADHQPKAAFREQMENLRSQIETLSSEVHNLSHQLHPANLEQLGLVTALKGFLREIQLNGMLSIEFSQKNVPVTIGDEISLCLYRIVQEAIRNVVKHSRATKAFIELIGEPDRVCLRIFDSGVGFNPERINGEKVGLGIVSMQERVRFLEGKINIQSQSDKGTQIDVEIPILS